MRKLLLPGLLALLVGGVAIWYLSHRDQSPAATPPLAAATAAPAPSARAQPAATAPAAQVPVSDPALGRAELRASAQMYAAHAPLRTPEVTDPDTAANRAILTTMVNKALAHQHAEKPPVPAPAPAPVTR